MKKLFDEFSNVSTDEWEKIVHRDLKGADYNKKLITKTYENILLKPYYRKEDIERENNLAKKSNDWDIQQTISSSKPKQANAIALNYLNRGANSLLIKSKLIGKKIEGIHISNQDDMNTFLKNIQCEYISTHFDGGFSSIDLFTMLLNSSDSSIHHKLNGSLHFDPIQLHLNEV